MALGNVFLVSQAGQMLPSATRFRTEANATAINAGEPVKIGGTGVNYVIPSADAEPVTTGPTFAGIAASTSTQTASLDGVVDVYIPHLGQIWGCKAKTAASLDTDAELLAVLNDFVLFDLTGTAYTVDVAAAGANNGLQIVGGDITTSTVYFIIRSGATIFN